MNYDHGGNLFALAGEMGVRYEELTDFSASINPLGISSAIRSAILDGVDGLVHYPYANAEPLCAALAAFHGVAPDQVVAANGTTELIYLLPRIIAGTRAMIVAPAFSEYERSLVAAGWTVRHHCLDPAKRFDLNIDALARDLSTGDYRMLFLCNPANPTGRLYSVEEIGAVAALCRSRELLLVLDEAFMDFCGEEASAIPVLIPDGGVIVLRSMTKFHAIPGLRLGYAVANPSTVAAICQARGPWSVNSLAMAAGMAALADEDFRQRTIAYVIAERKRFASALADIRGISVFASDTNYLLAQLSTPISSGELRRLLLGKQLLIRDCANFHGLDGSFVRMAVRRPDENETLLAALKGLVSDRVS